MTHKHYIYNSDDIFHSSSINTAIKVGKYFISCSDDGTIKGSELIKDKLELCFTLKGHQSAVTSVARIDENRIVSASRDKTIRVWDIKEQKEIHIIPTKHIVTRVAHIKDDFIISCDRKGDIYIHELLAGVDKGGDEPIVFLDSPIKDISILNNKVVVCTLANDFLTIDIGNEIFQELENDISKPIFHMKTILLGDKGAGKTTVAYFLKHKEFNDKIISTHGMRFFDINMGDLSYAENKEGEFHLNIWDFGGQPEYQLSHKQCYKNAKMVFLVVNLSKNESEDKDCLYWINSIKEHKNEMSKNIKVFIIGTQSINKKKSEKRLKSIEELLKNEIKGISTETIIESCLEEDDNFSQKIKNFINKDFKIESERSLTLQTRDTIKEIKKLSKQKYSVDIEKFDIRAINILEEDGFVEKKEQMLFLKPYWKNIFATSILREAQNNSIVSGAIKEKNLYSYEFGVLFDKSIDNNDKESKEKKEDNLLYNDFKEDDFLKKEIMKDIVTNFYKDMVCYKKTKMFIFPSRFCDDTLQELGTLDFFEISEIKLVSKKNTEVTIGTIVSFLYHYKEFTIKKHLYDGIELYDKQNKEFLVKFERAGLLEDSKNQHQMGIKIYAKENTTSKDLLISLIKTLLKNKLISVYETYHFVNDKDTALTVVTNEEDFTIENFIKLSDKNSFDTRELLRIEKEEIEEEKNNSLENIESFYNQKDEDKEEKYPNILHLSDLHFTKDTNIDNELKLLLKDFSNGIYFDNRAESKDNNIEITDIDYIVISGDITQGGQIEEFKVAYTFISELARYCNISAQQIIVCVGNHDYDREITHKAYKIQSKKRVSFNKGLDYSIDDELFLQREIKNWSKKFDNFSKYLYEPLYHQTFSYDKKEQIKVIKDDKITFYVVNSSSEIDHFNTQSVKFDSSILLNKIDDIEDNDSTIKICVGHHPLSMERDYAFINILQQYNFKAYMHGHIHRNFSLSFTNPQNSLNEFIQIGSGLFSYPNKDDLIYPYRYNIVQIKDKEFIINTRTRENIRLT